MNVHLVRSKEVSKDLYWDVVELLQEFKGPANYISSEPFTDYEYLTLKSEIIDDEEQFTTKSLKHLQISEFDEMPFSFPMTRQVATWEQLFQKCREYREKRDLGSEEYVLLLTDIPNDKNWFMMMDNTRRNAFIHTADWEYYLDINPKYPIAYQVVEFLLHSHMIRDLNEYYTITHRHPLGCVSDMVQNKKDVTLKLRTADICPACQTIIRERQVSTGLVNQILNTMEGIRSQMLFRERFRYHLQPSRLEFNLLQKKAVMLDIQNLTIRLSPLETTVYYFFLKRPDGVELKNLDEHTGELYRIYSKCSVASSDNNIAAMRNSIDALVNPLENSLNEKISRIKSKFSKELGDELAQHYLIHRDEHNGRYKIDIDRKLVKLVEE